MTIAESLLCSILGCGILDISVIDGCEYCWDDVLVEMQDSGMEICLESICYSILRIGMREMQDAIDARINEIEDELLESERNMDVEYRALLSISPYDDLVMYALSFLKIPIQIVKQELLVFQHKLFYPNPYHKHHS